MDSSAKMHLYILIGVILILLLCIGIMIVTCITLKGVKDTGDGL
jgi:hypothetical protein